MTEAGPDSSAPKPSGEGTKIALITTIGVVLGAAITAAGGYLAARGGQLPGAFEAAPTNTPTTTVTTTQTVTAPPSITPPDESNPPSSSGSDQPDSSVVYLDSLEAIEDGFEEASVSWGTATFSHSLLNPMSGCGEYGPADWVVPVGSSRFRAEIGVPITAAEPDARITFNVFEGGRQLTTKTVGVGEHVPISLSVTGGSRLRLESIIDQERRSNCNTEAEAVWGDARFTDE